MSITYSENQKMQTQTQSMPIWLSLLYFGFPALIMFVSYHVILPRLPAMGMTQFEAIVLVTTIPLALMLVAAIIAFVQEDRASVTWANMRARFRYPALRWRDVGLGLLVFIGGFVGFGIMQGITSSLIEKGIITLPVHLPALFDPRQSLNSATLDSLVGGSIRGNWSVVVLYFIMLFFNIVGEEFWWRGYILPRQEKQHGRFAWVWHGILWTSFHVFKWWDLLNLLPICLLISFFAQRTHNSWPGFIAHYLFNGLGFLGILAAVLGLV